MKVLTTIKHAYILEYADYFQDKQGYSYYLTRFLDSRSKSEYSGRTAKEILDLEEDFCISYGDRYERWLYRLTLALRYLSERNIIHRNIRLETIYLNGDNEPKAFLGDFYLQSNKYISTVEVGDLAYTAKEIINSKDNPSYDTKVDVYSLGVLMIALF